MIQDSDLEFIDYGNLPDQPGKEASAFTPTGLDDPLGLSFGSAGPGPLTPDDFSPMPANESVLRHFERRRSAEKGMAGDIGHTLHALHDSLKTDPFRLARGVKDTGLSPFVLDSDFAFGQEKLRSEEFREQMRFFADNAEKMPVTMSLMREFDNNADTLALMMDKRLFDLESRLPENQQSGWGHVAGAWEAGMLQREANSLLMNPLFRGVALTEEEEDRLSVINQTLQYQARQKEKLGLPARMARGSVESLGVPLAGGLASGANMGAAGMAIGAAAGAGAFLPGAVAGGFAGLAAGLTAGAVRDIFEQEAALTYNELRNMTDDYGNRIDDGTARALAAATGLANAGLEYFGFKQMAAVVPGLDKLVTGGAAKAAASWLANNPKVLARVGEGGLKAALGIAGEVGTELGQEIVNLAAEEIGRRNSVIDVAAPSAKEVRDRLFDVVKGTIEATVLPMGLAGGVRVYRGARRQDALQELSAARSRLFDTLVDAARNSRVLEELPENGEALISALAESGVVPETVYIRPEAAQRVFFQGALEEDAEGGGAVNPERSAELERLAAELGITPESLEESLTLGTDIAVPTEKAVRHLFRDEGLYNSLRGDMRFDPEQRTDAELEELLAMNEDAAKRQAYLDDILNGAAEEMDTAATRHDMRMEMTKSHRDQLVADGFTEAQADAHGLILAAGAERFARMRGVTPGEWLDENFAGFYGMTREEFEGLRTTPEDAERERMYEQLMSDMGVKKGMSRTARRRVLQPEFGYSFGNLNPESVINTYGKSVYNQLRHQFGPRFFARKGEGLSFDVMAMEFQSQERGGYFNANDVDGYAFMDKVMMPHDEFEAGWKSSMGGALYQLDRNGNAVAPGESNPKIARVVEVDPAKIVDKDGKPLNLKNTAALREWVKEQYQGRTVRIDDDGKLVLLGRKGIESSVKRRGEKQRQAYADLDTAIENAVHDPESFEEGNADHPHVEGQEIYYGAAKIGDRYFSVRFKLDKVTADKNLHYKDHKVSEIQIAPSLSGSLTNGLATQAGNVNDVTESAIRGISLSVLRGDVKPSRIEKGVLFQPAFEGPETPATPLGKGITEIDVDGVQRPAINSNGQPIHWSEEGIRNFWRWFGDSKAVDGDGRPLVVHHNTGEKRTEFDRKYVRKAMEIEAHFFAPEVDPYGEYGPVRNDVYLRIVNPADFDTAYKDFSAGRTDNEGVKQREKLQEQGHDGGIMVEDGRPYEYFVFDSNQIKSATDNRGTFDPDDPRILHQQKNRGARGAIRQLDDGRWLVGLFQNRDFSTIVHETGHFFMEQLRGSVGLENAPQWVGDSWAALQKVYGFKGFPEGGEWVRVQERFATDFEAYLREGKAPSHELRTAFEKFRTWLTDIYRTIKSLLGDNHLSPEVREVFDRLLATDEEIELARRDGGTTAVMDSLGEDVAPELRDRYAAATRKAHDNASALIAARRLVEQRAKERELRATATAKVDADPTYRLVNEIRERGGLSLDALLTRVSEDTAYRLRDRWHERGRKGLVTRKKTTVDIDEAAALFDAENPRQMVGMLLSMPTRLEAVQSEVDAGLAQWEADFDGSIEYSDAMDEAFAVELEALTGRKQASPTALRREMELRAGMRKSRDVDAEYKSLKASLRKQNQILKAALREWKAAARQENAQALRTAKENLARVREQERIKRAALGAAYRARMERDRIVAQVRKSAQSKTVEDAYKQQILRLAAHWRGLGTPTTAPRDPANTPTLQTFMGQNVGLFAEEEGLVPEWIYQESGHARGAAFNDLTLEQMRGVARVVKLLEHKGRQYGKLLAQGRKTETLLAARECAGRMDKLAGKRHITEHERESFIGKLHGGLRGALSATTVMRHLFRALDNYSDSGPMRKYFTDVFTGAKSRELKIIQKVNADIVRAATAYLKGVDLKKAFAIDGVPLPQDVDRDWGGLWTMEKVLCVALNMGNAGNMKALLGGYGLSAGHVETITRRMTANHWSFVQSVWDATETMYPELSAVYETLHGIPMNKVEAASFTAQTADGQTIRLRGGYYPLVFDRNFSDRAAEQKARDDLMNSVEAVQRNPNPRSGMTKTRVGGMLPPKLSLGVISNHIRDTAHFTTHVLPLRDAVHLVKNPVFRQAFERAAGQENYNELLPWLQNIARPEGQYAGMFQRTLERLGELGSLYALGLNMKSALLQLTSVGSSMKQVGVANFLKGCAAMLRSPRGAWDAVREKSIYMQNRSSLFDVTARTAFSRMGGARLVFGRRFFSPETVQRAQMAFIVALDAAVAYPTWIASYDKAVASGMADGDAVTAADSAVIEAQASGGEMDVAAVMRGRGWMRFLCPFMSFALNDFNRKRHYVGGMMERFRSGASDVTFGEFAKHFALEWVMPVFLSAMLVSLGRDDELPDTEDFVWEALTFYSMGIPFVRDAVRFAESQAGHGGAPGRIGGVVGWAGIENFVRASMEIPDALFEDDEKAQRKALKGFVNTIGFFTGIGTPQLWRTLEGSEAYFVDDEGGVLAPLLGKPRPGK